MSAGDSFLLLGFVYFEFDCWNRLRNPYIPLDVANPTLHQDLQRNLQGEGKAERLQVIADANKEYHECRKTGADPSSSQAVRRWVEMNSEDILRERRRIGGDWAIAGCLTHRSTRDALRRGNLSVLQSFIQPTPRLCLGEDLLIVVLTMSEEDLRERLSLRHSGYQSVTDALMVCTLILVFQLSSQTFRKLQNVVWTWRRMKKMFWGLKSVKA